MEILGSWVVVAVRVATSPRTSRGLTGRASARLNVELSSLWLSLNPELFGPGKVDEQIRNFKSSVVLNVSYKN